jgi:hypothetical protein
VRSIQAAVDAKDAAQIYVELPMFRAAMVAHAFTRDWASVTELLASRIRSEEDRLYGMYEAAARRRDGMAAARF